jgi:hypothetical protein
MNPWHTIRSYIVWTHDRGTLHYDIMVVLILAFIFVAPMYVDFKDQPRATTPHATQVLVSADGQNGFIYEVDASGFPQDETAIRDRLYQVIEPIAGEVEIQRFEPVHDRSGHVRAYKAWVRKP